MRSATVSALVCFASVRLGVGFGCHSDADCSDGGSCFQDGLNPFKHCQSVCVNDSDCAFGHRCDVCATPAPGSDTPTCFCVFDLRLGCENDYECADGGSCFQDGLIPFKQCHSACDGLSGSGCPFGQHCNVCGTTTAGPDTHSHCWCTGGFNAEVSV